MNSYSFNVSRRLCHYSGLKMRAHVFLKVLNLKARSTPLPLGVRCQRPAGRNRVEREVARGVVSAPDENDGWMAVVVIVRPWWGGGRMGREL
jgi:hypothetical protein